MARSRSSISRYSAIESALASMLRRASRTNFGLPVVPDVDNRTASSSASPDPVRGTLSDPRCLPVVGGHDERRQIAVDQRLRRSAPAAASSNATAWPARTALR